MEDSLRGFRVNVGPRRKRFDQARIGSQVRYDPQLDLVVVGDKKLATIGRNKRPTKLSPFLASNRNVVKIRAIRAEPAGPGDGLVERGMDSTIVAHLSQQTFSVGRAQFLHLPVTNQGVDNWVFGANLFQCLRVGRIAGLGFLVGFQTEFVEQNSTKLRDRVDDELLPRQFLYLGFQFVGLLGQRL